MVAATVRRLIGRLRSSSNVPRWRSPLSAPTVSPALRMPKRAIEIGWIKPTEIVPESVEKLPDGVGRPSSWSVKAL